ncbi:imidazole glycerol phosphate synthase subunit HisH [Allobranchiibius sp. GilTou38]|uniref:imidazole glycerol phosphate synthase subunit HisH n=1 Tax=Allobranchiibius sp. GilTou38 TaxID=2815210 RepID=UPI001AA1AA05|nr:imidazole glycerol phosphate synthase subunit HisH [Allobranchiibius sp. GilTou38]
MKQVVVLDYGSGNIRSVVRMLERVGAQVELTADPESVRRADGLYVPGVGNFHACVAGLRQVGGPELIGERLAARLPVLGVCVGFQVLFEGSTEHYATDGLDGIGVWPGTITRLEAPVVPHMGWSQVRTASGSALFRGIEDEWFYFVHSYAASQPPASGFAGPDRAPRVSTAEHGEVFVAAVEDGALWGTQFHPEKSGDAGAALIENWLASF